MAMGSRSSMPCPTEALGLYPSMLVVAASCSIFPYPTITSLLPQAGALTLTKYHYLTFLFNWISQCPRMSLTHLFIQLLEWIGWRASKFCRLSRLCFPGESI
ncbi:hypothetical protein ARMGADRAFT_127155 [Armillaria gallica]|uniref:Uncharacterized protein n=1 Tax=Armillaria gallica TaxID=47427 RepID=A0A2H3DYZ9_ARMGA|nr:hypothetical protein ARMGADRAFT_127155 [Armillaria gallica]